MREVLLRKDLEAYKKIRSLLLQKLSLPAFDVLINVLKAITSANSDFHKFVMKRSNSDRWIGQSGKAPIEIVIILIEHIIDVERDMFRSIKRKLRCWWLRHEDFYILPPG